MADIGEREVVVGLIRRSTGKRDDLLRTLHTEGVSIPTLARAAGLSVGKTHAIATEVRGTMFTIGYEGRTVEEFVNTLRVNGVGIVVDVRQNAVSRKPGFGKNALVRELAGAAISYQHMPELGNPKDNRDGFRDARVTRARRRYEAILEADGRRSFREMLALANSARIALMCFERDELHCHRYCLAQRAQRDHPRLTVSRL